MRPERFRRRLGFALAGAAPFTLLTAAPALSQGLSSSNLMGAVPLAIALGAGAFALLAVAVVRKILHDASLARQQWSEVTRPAELAKLVSAGIARLGGKS